MLRRIITLAVIFLLLVVVVVFTWLNRGPISLDLGFFAVDTQIAVAFTITFALGWLFGLFCAGFFVLKSMNERRRLRKSLAAAEQEVSSLRSLPLQDATE